MLDVLALSRCQKRFAVGTIRLQVKGNFQRHPASQSVGIRDLLTLLSSVRKRE